MITQNSKYILSKEEKDQINKMANGIRALTLDAILECSSGHHGMPLGTANIACVLYKYFLKSSKLDPRWPNRDRFILSAGHGSMLAYSLLHFMGFEDFSMDQIKRFRKPDSNTTGHPESHIPGIDATTGPLGQGIANAVGMAISEMKLRGMYGDDMVNHKIYAIAGDGCMMEGISHEALSLAGYLQLNNLIVIYDNNYITIDGETQIADSTDINNRFHSYGWEVLECSSNSTQQIYDVLSMSQKSDKPVLIKYNSILGHGLPYGSGISDSHSYPFENVDCDKFKEFIGYPKERFAMLNEVYELFKHCSKDDEYKRWIKSIEFNPKKDEFLSRVNGSLDIEKAIDIIKKCKIEHEKTKDSATRNYSGIIINAIKSSLPDFFIGGSADLGYSTKALTKNSISINYRNRLGNYIHYGVREHGMGSIMNGIMLHGFFFAYASTFLSFADYLRPSIRIAALSNLRSIFIMTHDSIGVGEDGPTHQPVEHLISLRSIPNVNVMRPADMIETAECWEIALTSNYCTVMCLSRQGVESMLEYRDENLSLKGGYISFESILSNGKNICISATGTELSVAYQVKDILLKNNIGCRIVSVPSWNLLVEQEDDYIDSIISKINDNKSFDLNVVIEAGRDLGWYKIMPKNSIYITVNEFGRNGTKNDLYDYFGITPEKIISKINEKI